VDNAKVNRTRIINILKEKAAENVWWEKTN
jgi:hypothetical protein